MSIKQNLAIGATVIGLALGANAMLEPRTPSEQQRQIQEQRIDDLSDSVENSNDRKRDEGNDGVHSENARKLDPGEHRPPEKTRIRLRLP